MAPPEAGSIPGPVFPIYLTLASEIVPDAGNCTAQVQSKHYKPCLIVHNVNFYIRMEVSSKERYQFWPQKSIHRYCRREAMDRVSHAWSKVFGGISARRAVYRVAMVTRGV